MTRTNSAAFPPPGARLELTIRDLSLDGGAMARHEGGVIFLDQGLPGETVQARVTRIKAGYALAQVEASLSPSPHERPSFCGNKQCGGCAWTTLDYAAECAWKDRQLRETLSRLGGLPRSFTEDALRFPALLPSPASLGYRNKMEFAFAPDPAASGRALLGLRKRNSREVTAIDECGLASLPVGALLAEVRAWAAERRLPAWGKREGFLRFLVARDSGSTQLPAEGKPGWLVELITGPCSRRSSRQQAVRELAERLLARGLCCGFSHSLRSDAADVAYGEQTRLSAGRSAMAADYGSLILEAPPGAFLQINTPAAALLYATIGEFSLAGQDVSPSKRELRILDCYAGVGGVALTLAALPAWSGATVIGVENTGPAVLAARENARQNGLDRVVFQQGDAAAFLAAEETTPDLLVADPPRAGLSEAVLGEILRLGPARLILVSCNPATLARDVSRLTPKYTPRLARGIDLFPHTPHLETVLLLERKAGYLPCANSIAS